MNLAHAQLLRAAKKHKFEIPAYCYMPDHVHVFSVAASSDADFVAFVNLTKQLSSYYFKREFKRILWQDGFHDRVLREDEDSADVIAYIIMNPVRAGLVVSPTDYPFWDSETHSREQLLEFVGSALSKSVRRP